MPSAELLKSGRLFAGVVAVAASWSLPVGSASAQESELEEIVVTAQKRAENLQDVPISITAMSGESLASFGFENAVQISQQVPNFNVDGAFGPNGPPQLSMRGVSILDFSDSNESSVAMYVDEISQGTVAGQTAQLFDLKRVEILRGPQGTLYGRNTPGGLVQFISNAPTPQFEAGGSLQAGSFSQRIAEGFVSGPLSDRLRARLAAKYNRDDGYQTNVATDTRFGQTKVASVRGLLEWQPLDSLTLSGKAFYSKSDGSHPGYGVYGQLDPTSSAHCTLAQIEASQCVNDAGFRDPDPDPKHVYSERSRLPENLETYGGSLRLTWDNDLLQFVSITGYEKMDKMLTEDCDSASVSAFVCVGEWTADNSQFTQEFRLSGGTRLHWIAGSYYYGDRKFVTVVLPSLGGFGSYATTETKSLAWFAQADASLSERLSLVAGARYTHEKRDLTELAGVTGGVAGSRDGTPYLGPLSDDLSSGRVTGKLGLEFRPKEHALVYATVSTGFKSGMFNTTLLNTPDERGPVGDETITAYEIGTKNTWWDGRARFNAAAFYNDYRGFQTSAVVLVDNIPNSRFINAGDAKIQGAELELSLLPSPRWELGLGVGLLHSRIDASAETTVGGVALDGKETPVSPSASVNGMVRYNLPVGGGGNASLQVDFSWKDHYFFTPQNSDFASQDAYALVNVRGAWRSPTGRYELSAFVHNIADKQYATYAYFSPSASYAYKVWGLPRWAGLKLEVNF